MNGRDNIQKEMLYANIILLSSFYFIPLINFFRKFKIDIKI